MSAIKSNTSEYRIWLRRKNEKDLIRRTKKRQAVRAERTRVIKHNTKIKAAANYNAAEKRTEFEAPPNFSFVDNPNETIDFFRTIISFITNRLNSGKQIYIDISKIQNLSIDALMYLLAILNNMNGKIKSKFSVSGNAPKDPTIRKLFNESGFYSFVRYTGAEPIVQNADTVQIVSGCESDNSLARHICDFVMTKAGLSRAQCRFMYVMMVEMMANVFKHAYNCNDVLYPRWYCFVKYLKEEGTVAFTFMDTGEGIPSTVRRNFAEKLDLLKIKSEYKYVESALNGDFRTSTHEEHRGTGLPKIRKFCTNEKIQNMRIITSKADVSVLSKSYRSKDLEKPLIGTLFSWKINLAKC